MAIFLTAFAVSTLAALGLDRAAGLLASEDGRRRILQWTGGAAAGLAVGGVLAASGVLLTVWEAVLYPDLPGSRVPALEALHPHMVRGFFVVAALVGMLAGIFRAAGQKRVAAPLLLAAVTALVVVDLVRVNAPFIQVVDPARVTVPDPNLRFLEARTRDEPPFRVFSMVQGGQDVQPSAFGIDLAAGHHPNDLGRYRELIGMVGSGIPEHLATFHPVILAILNVRYVLWPDAQYGSLEGVEPVSQVQLADGRTWASVHPYPGLPRARLVGSYRMVGEGEALAILLEDETFDPRVEVLLEDAPPFDPEPRADGVPHSPGSVRWIENLPDRLVLEVEADQPSLLVVSQNWFPSWVARVNGESTPVLRADHALQAVAIPAGRHRVELAVESAELRQALLLSGFSLLTVLLAGLASGLLARRERGSNA